MPQVAGIRRFGAAALDLAWVAAGRYDGYWELGLKPWDMRRRPADRARGRRLRHRPGRRRTRRSSDVVAANPHLHARLREAVADGIARAAA